MMSMKRVCAGTWCVVVGAMLCLAGCADDSETDSSHSSTGSSTTNGDSDSSASVDWKVWEAPECELGTMPVFGNPECQPVGAACPSGIWPDSVVAEGAVVYVSAGGTGDGASQSSPLGSIARAIEQVGSEGTVVVAKGRYTEAIDVHGRVHILGACAAETVLVAPSVDDIDPVIDLTGAGGGTIENVMVTGERVGVWIWANETPVQVRGVIIDGARVNGLLMTDDGAGATIEELVVQNTQPTDGNLFDGMGMHIDSTGETSFTNVWMYNNQNIAIDVHGIDVHGIDVHGLDSKIDVHGISFDGVVIQDTQPKASDNTAGWGLLLEDGAQVTFSRALIERSHRQAIDVHGIGTQLVASQVVVKDTRPQLSDSLWGHGLHMGDGARVELRGAIIDGSHLVGIDVHGLDGVLDAQDITVSNTKPQKSDQRFGLGMIISQQAQAKIVNATFDNNHTMGIWAIGEGVSLELESASITNTRSQASDLLGGRGLELAAGAQVTLKGVVVDGNRDIGMGVFGAQTRVDAEGLAVLNTQKLEASLKDGASQFGYGVVVAGATLNMLDFQLSQNAAIGLQLLDSTPCVEQFDGLPIVQCADGLISSNDIGVNNQLDDLAFEDIFTNVTTENNLTEDFSLANLATGCNSEQP